MAGAARLPETELGALFCMAVGKADDDTGGQPDKEADLDHADGLLDIALQGRHVQDPPQMHIEDIAAVIAYIGLPASILRLPQDDRLAKLLQPLPGRLPSKRHDGDRKRK